LRHLTVVVVGGARLKDVTDMSGHERDLEDLKREPDARRAVEVTDMFYRETLFSRKMGSKYCSREEYPRVPLSYLL